MKNNFIRIIILIFILLSSVLYSRERMKIATIDLDHSLKANEPMRKEIVKMANRFAYLKHSSSISVDKKKKSLFGTNELTLEQGLIVASSLNIQAAIIMNSEKILKSTNNYEKDNLTINSNDMNRILSNLNITNTVNDNIVLTNETKDLGNLLEYAIGENKEKINKNEKEKKDEELYEIVYNFKVIDINTKKILKEYNNNTASQTISIINQICTYLEFYFSNMILKSLEHQINNINLNFIIERITFENKTNAIVNTDKIAEGESFTINFRSNMEGYVYIIALQNDGTAILMHPNDFNNFIDDKYQNKIEAKKKYIIPPPNSIFRIAIRPPLGIDSFYALYTKNEQKWITGIYFNSGDGFKICDINRIAEFASKLKSKFNEEWQISKIYLETVPEINR